MNEAEWKKLKKEYYRSNTICTTDDGTIDFSPEDFEKLVTNGHRITYDEYLDIMWKSGQNVRHSFAECFYSGDGFAQCKGKIQGFTTKKHKVIFKRLHVTGTYSDGLCFNGKEDHVWMNDTEFKNFSAGDNVTFEAEVYRYLKTANGKKIDFGLRNPSYIKKTGDYQLPTDDELLMQDISHLVCEMCLFRDHCYNIFCMNEQWANDTKQFLFNEVKKR